MRPTIFPSVSDITMVTPTKITDSGVYVKLLEYNDIEGLIILSDISKSRIRSVNKITPIGKRFAAFVQSVDEKTNNITLSKKSVTVDEQTKCEANFKIVKQINDLVKLFCNKVCNSNSANGDTNGDTNSNTNGNTTGDTNADANSNTNGDTNGDTNSNTNGDTNGNANGNTNGANTIIDTQYIYNMFIWPLSHDPETLDTALRTASKDFSRVYPHIQPNNMLGTIFSQVLQAKYKSNNTVLEAVMEIHCYDSGGITVIKNALTLGAESATTEIPFKIKLIKSPYYSITVKTSAHEQAIEAITNALNIIETSLPTTAIFKVIKLPEIVVDKEFEPESESE